MISILHYCSRQNKTICLIAQIILNLSQQGVSIFRVQHSGYMWGPQRQINQFLVLALLLISCVTLKERSKLPKPPTLHYNITKIGRVKHFYPIVSLLSSKHGHSHSTQVKIENPLPWLCCSLKLALLFSTLLSSPLHSPLLSSHPSFLSLLLLTLLGPQWPFFISPRTHQTVSHIQDFPYASPFFLGFPRVLSCLAPSISQVCVTISPSQKDGISFPEILM